VELMQTTLADLRGSLASGVRALLDEAFPDRAPGEEDYYSAHGSPTLIMVLREGEHVIGHLAAYQREVGIADETLRIGMIGGVAIAPDCRGRGHSRELVEQAHMYLKSQSVPFSILFAYEPRVYASSGYKLMQNQTHFLDADGAWKTFVFRGSMYAELSGRSWPNQPLDLRGRVV
jgi:predicted acetyltransferase